MNTHHAAATIDHLGLLNNLQRILSEGAFVASYKYALILALAELAVEQPSAPDGSLIIPLAELSERFILLYWHQTAPFAAGTVLHQSAGRQASVISMISNFRSTAPTIAAGRRHRRCPSLVRRVGQVLQEQPLWRLQRIGPDRLDFLYEEKLINDAVVLRPGIPAFLQQQFPIVQALVQMAWLTFVQKLAANRLVLGSTGDLAAFLFGADRCGLTALIDGLRAVQCNRCFYCERSLDAEIEVDHFIPWSRYPRDLAHNFVLTDRRCNQSKAEMLAAPTHPEHWMCRNRTCEAELQQVFSAARFVADVDASCSVTEWAYEHAERAGSLVWVRDKEMTHLSPEWRSLF